MSAVAILTFSIIREFQEMFAFDVSRLHAKSENESHTSYNPYEMLQPAMNVIDAWTWAA